ncbi:MAG TPA: VWA domain-containing protein [Thermoanaerobaculia bacterium]|nr:VWA domain-containing protein [Thermoanaerobaculia bacterium]
MHTFRSGCLAVLALLAAIVPAAAQQKPSGQPQAPQSVFGEQIEVRVVNVEAVVTDRQGNRVTGLKPGDFRLEVDGKTVPIEYFNEVRGGSAVAPGEEDRTSPVKGLPSLVAGSPVGTSYLVFVDNYFSLGPRRDEVLRDLKEQLSQLGPEDRMAIVAWDGGQVEMLTSWSSSARQLGDAIEKAIGERTYGIARLAELRTFQSSRRLAGGGLVDASPRRAFAQQADIEELEFAQRLVGQTERAVAAAVSTLHGFAAPPGRKVMLLLSGGWPYSVMDYVIDNPNRPIIEREVPRGEEILEPLVDTANRLGYTLYTVDVPGIEGTAADASLAFPAATGLNIREQEHEATLLYVAQQTGGKALLNSQSAQLLQVAAADTRSYYWLGFTPAWQGNDKVHKVKLSVLPKGLTVRSRTGFLDLSRKAENSLIVESAMMFGNSPDVIPMAIKLGAPVASGRREMEVPVSLAIPVDAITFVPVNGKQTAELELRVAAVDSAGNRAPVPVIPITLTGNEAPKPGMAVRYDTRLKLRKLPHHLTLAIFDPLSGKILTAQANVAPPK